MARYKAGEAEALIVPSLDGFGRKLRAAFEAMPDAEYTVDVLPDLGGFPARLEAELAKLDAEVAVDIVPDLDGFYAQLETALTDQSITVEVEADTAAAEAQIAATAAARRAEIQAEADTAAAEARLAELTAQRDAEIQVELDESSAAGVAARMAMLARDREIDMNVDLDTAAATAKLALLGVQAAMVTGAIGAGLGGVVGLLGVAAGAVGGLGIGFMGLGTAALPIIGAIALGTDGIKQAAQEAAPAFTSLKESISGVFGEEMKAGFQDISGILEGLTPGMEGVASGLSGMFNSTFELIRNDGMGELNTLLAGIPPMLSQLQPGLDALVMGFLDVGQAAGPALGSMGAGLSEMLGAIGGALTEMQSNGTLTVIFNEMGNALAGVGAGVGDLLTALGDIGMNVLPVVEPLFRSLGQAFLNMAPGLASAGAALGTALGPVLEQVGTTIGGIGTQLAPLLPMLGQFVTALLQGIGPLLPILSTLGQTLLGAITPVLPILSQVLQVVGGALAEAFQAIAPALLPLATAAGQVISALAPILPLAGQLIASLATALAPAISGIATALGPVIASLASAFMPVLAALTPTLTMLGQMIGQVAGQIGGVLVQAVTMLAPFLPQIAAAFMQILQAVMPLIPQLIQLVVTGLMGLLPVLIQLMPTFVRFINILAQVVGVVAQVLGVFIQVVQWLGTLTAAIVGFVTGNGEQLRQFWEGVKAGFSEMIGNVVSAVAGWASAMSAQLGAMASAAIAQVVNWWNGMTARVAEGVQNVVSRVGEIPGKITGFFADAGQWLYNAGKDVVTGLINGLTDMLGEAYERVKGMAENITNVAKDALGIASPSRVFMEIGAFVSEGLALGIEQSARQPSDSISDTVGGIVGTAASTVADGVRRTANSTAPRARPGLFTGVGGPRDDANLVRVSDREFIVNAEATDQWRPFLDAINFGGLIPGFADGGQPGGPRSKVNESQLVQFARGLEGKPYVWGGVNFGDCSGAMSAIARFATGLDPFGGRFATGNEGEALRGMGFENGRWQKGYLGIGWTTDPGGPGVGHTAGTLSEGTNVEMGGARGNGQFGGGAAGANDGQFRNQMRIRVKDPFQPNVPGRVGLSGTSDPSIDVTADGFTPSTAGMTSGVSASATPSSWSDFAGDMASVAAKSATSDLLGIFGIADEMPWWMQVHQAMSATPLQDGQAPTPIADTPDEVLADPTLAATVALNPMPEPPKSEGSNHIWDPAQGAEQWRPMVRAAMKRQGHTSKAEEDAWIRQIQSESGGNPGIKQGIIDVNSGGNEAVGLLQIIPGTFAAHRDPELPNDRRNAWANVNAAIRYGHARYGAGLLDAIGDGDGYKDGGLIPGLGGVRQDSIGIKVSPGEYVSHAVATAANLPLFEALNADPYLLHNIPRAISAVPTAGAAGGVDASIHIGQITTTDWSEAQRGLAREQGRQVRNLSMAGSVTG